MCSMYVHKCFGNRYACVCAWFVLVKADSHVHAEVPCPAMGLTDTGNLLLANARTYANNYGYARLQKEAKKWASVHYAARKRQITH